MSNMEIIETFRKGKSPEKVCEDLYAITDSFVAVIDGVTSKSDFRSNGKTTGRLAAEIIKSVIQTMPRDITLKGFLAAVNEHFTRMCDEYPYLKNNRDKGMQAVCAIYSDYYREIWMIGDCQVMVDGREYRNNKPSDEILSNMRSLVISCMRSDHTEQESMDAARSIVLPWILESTKFANRADSPYGFALINGEEIPDSLIRKIALDSLDHEIILASDGYPFLKNTLAESEHCLKQTMLTDPACCTFLSTKALCKCDDSFDDRTYIRFVISNQND